MKKRAVMPKKMARKVKEKERERKQKIKQPKKLSKVSIKRGEEESSLRVVKARASHHSILDLQLVLSLRKVQLLMVLMTIQRLRINHCQM